MLYLSHLRSLLHTHLASVWHHYLSRMLLSTKCCLVITAAATAGLWRGQNNVSALALPSSTASNIRRAMDLSNKANVDPTFAKEACELWCSILDTTDCADTKLPPLPLSAMPAAHALHASTLVRIGRDKEAIAQYQKSLTYLKDAGALSKPLTKEESDIRMGMGKSLQRLLRYREAADTFIVLVERCYDDNGVVIQKRGVQLARADSMQCAALCYMRIGELNSAIAILDKPDIQGADLNGMLGALLLLQIMQSRDVTKAKGGERKYAETIKRAKELLLDSIGDTSTPLYNWLYLTINPDQLDETSCEPFHGKKEVSSLYLSFALVNNSPFDDPDLINLDDKILLHSAMSPCYHGNYFWPLGHILPDESDRFKSLRAKDTTNRKEWILKERSGYGSHGNTIASFDEVLSIYDERCSEEGEQILCQRVVEPPMLIEGRKFSLRIYVVYFPEGRRFSADGDETMGSEVYVSASEGLVKYASALYGDNSDMTDQDDQYMTNSGRGDGRSSLQQNLRQLQSEFQSKGLDYDKMWNSIEHSIGIVMKRYFQLKQDEKSASGGSQDRDSVAQGSFTPFCSVPKILGFDYILDSSLHPYLLEVNRFPGLEPRSSMDADVKQSIVYDAWAAASDRMRIPKQYIQDLRPSKYKGFSLKKLTIS